MIVGTLMSRTCSSRILPVLHDEIDITVGVDEVRVHGSLHSALHTSLWMEMDGEARSVKWMDLFWVSQGLRNSGYTSK